MRYCIVLFIYVISFKVWGWASFIFILEWTGEGQEEEESLCGTIQQKSCVMIFENFPAVYSCYDNGQLCGVIFAKQTNKPKKPGLVNKLKNHRCCRSPVVQSPGWSCWTWGTGTQVLQVLLKSWILELPKTLQCAALRLWFRSLHDYTWIFIFSSCGFPSSLLLLWFSVSN